MQHKRATCMHSDAHRRVSDEGTPGFGYSVWDWRLRVCQRSSGLSKSSTDGAACVAFYQAVPHNSWARFEHLLKAIAG